MILLRPWWLLALPVLLLIAALVFRRPAGSGGWQTVLAPRMLAGMTALGWIDHGSKWSRAMPLAGAVALVLGLSGPATPKSDTPVFAQSDAVLLALDMSASVTSGNRAQALADLQAAAARIVGQLVGRPVGLILYAGEAYIAAAPTTDPAVLDSLIAVLDSQTMPDKSSNPAAALSLAQEMLVGTPRADLVLISDGGGISASAKAEAARLRASGVRIWALTVDGNPASDPTALQSIEPQRISPANAPEAVIAALDRAGLGQDPVTRALHYRDLGPFLAALAMLPMLVRFRRRA
ncbi:VWA domain-containing protein [Paracoccus aestuariivivens]|uniref:VWA domain-containing protein n=1 Tax=Paracoccus aestuariivivens TaxID=1820333 RepID=A0A6L6JDI9_9RHOB|nr:vWA domain-containing protein [Paracoccus aestuariivivens]MTH77981.1 VWA domain-containing protein [Paracoccus aestuariivivens]